VGGGSVVGKRGREATRGLIAAARGRVARAGRVGPSHTDGARGTRGAGWDARGRTRSHAWGGGAAWGAPGLVDVSVG
jgi:hypothetical protein